MQRLQTIVRRRLVAGLLVTAGVIYGAAFSLAYLHSTAPSDVAPRWSELTRLVFRTSDAVSPMERRLAASDTPLGTGPLISGGATSDPDSVGQSMQSPFSKGAYAASQLSPAELEEREGERLALLDWIRSGASQVAYHADDHLLVDVAPGQALTPALMHDADSRQNAPPARRVRIRSLIEQRCVTCHNAETGDDTARLVPFDNYESILRYLKPDEPPDHGRPWLLAALGSLFPLAAIAGASFARTRQPPAVRHHLAAVTAAALCCLAACWIAGPAFAAGLFAAALLALACILLQGLASIVDLLGGNGA